jgi:hypothetical protein
MAREPAPVRITTATRSHRDDVAHRQKRYLISMGIRTACFVLAVVSIGHWWLWIFLGASFFLPTIAVIVANSAAAPDPGGPEYFVPDPTVRSIEGPAGHTPPAR